MGVKNLKVGQRFYYALGDYSLALEEYEVVRVQGRRVYYVDVADTQYTQDNTLFAMSRDPDIYATKEDAVNAIREALADRKARLQDELAGITELEEKAQKLLDSPA